MSRENAWIQTQSGVKFYPFAPRIDDIRKEDIAGALSRICRFTGHTKHLYSVGQHSLIVSAIVHNDRARPWALMHDAAEAYIGDISSPLKRYAPELEDAEGRIAVLVRDKWNIPYDKEIADEVHRADLWLCYQEACVLLGNPHILDDWALRAHLKDHPFEPCRKYINPMQAVAARPTPDHVEREFLAGMHYLLEKRR